MKSPKLIYIMLVSILLSATTPAVVWATSVEEMKAEEAKIASQGEAINAEIETVIDEINKKYKEVAELDSKISKAEADITTTEAEIVETQENILVRTEVVTKRLQELQISEVGNTSLDALLGAESFSDFLNRAYAYTVLQNAENSKIDALYEEKEKLADLEEKLVATKKSLTTDQKKVKAEQSTLDTQVAGLKTKLDANASSLTALTNERISKENAIREAAIAAAAKAQAAKEEAARVENEKANTNTTTDSTDNSTTGTTNSNNNNSNTGNSNNNGGNQGTTPPPITVQPPVEPSKPSGNSFPGQATAYIATGNNTATGTVPTPGRTIAVDPSLIPLGSRVMIEVPGAPRYSGIYTAEDTGGVVKGAIIDVFVANLQEARNFGRQSIIITVL